MPSDLPTVESETETSNNDYNLGPESNLNDTVYDEHSDMSSFMPAPSLKKQEEDAVREQLSSSPTVSWPTLDIEPLSEFATPFLATLAFLTLFPDGQGDPTNPSLMRDVEFAEKVKHLLKFAEVKSGKWFYRFAMHPRFSYWALNMIQRRRALGQASFFIKQNPGEPHLSVKELQQMANNVTATNLMSKISHYVGNITGTNAYWHKVRDDLKVIFAHAGPPTFFFTFLLQTCIDLNCMNFLTIITLTHLVVKTTERILLTTLTW